MKIDTTQIPNFDALPEEARTAILGMEFADAPDMSLYVEKSVFDKKASEAAEANRKLKEKMTADELAEAERKKREEEREQRIAELEKKEAISNYKASFLALGYSEDNAKAAAEAMADGDSKKVFEVHKKAAEDAEKRLKEQLLNGTPKPKGTGGEDIDSPDVALGKRLGKARAESMKASNDAMKRYM